MPIVEPLVLPVPFVELYLLGFVDLLLFVVDYLMLVELVAVPKLVEGFLFRIREAAVDEAAYGQRVVGSGAVEVGPYLEFCRADRDVYPVFVGNPEDFPVALVVRGVLEGHHSGKAVYFFCKYAVSLHRFFGEESHADESEDGNSGLLHPDVHGPGELTEEFLPVGPLACKLVRVIVPSAVFNDSRVRLLCGDYLPEPVRGGHGHVGRAGRVTHRQG